MANKALWGSTTLTTVMSTELNSLANLATATSSSAYDNTTNLDMFCDIELLISSFGAGTFNNTAISAQINILESVDGVNFDSNSGSTEGFIWTGTGSNTSPFRITARNVMIPPTKFKFSVTNFTGKAWAASGNTLKILTYSYNLNG